MILSLYLICILQALQPYLDTLLQLLRVTTEFTNLLAHRLDLQHLRQKIDPLSLPSIQGLHEVPETPAAQPERRERNITLAIKR